MNLYGLFPCRLLQNHCSCDYFRILLTILVIFSRIPHRNPGPSDVQEVTKLTESVSDTGDVQRDSCGAR